MRHGIPGAFIGVWGLRPQPPEAFYPPEANLLPPSMRVAGDAFGHPGQLLGGGVGLVAGFPFGLGHAVDGFACRGLVEGDASFGGGVGQPVAEAVAAEAADAHQVDVLDVGAVLEMGDETTEGGGFKGLAGGGIQGGIGHGSGLSVETGGVTG